VEESPSPKTVDT
jgi:hypothetical protein